MTNGPEPKPRILAVDDTLANLVALDAVLSRDYEVIRAASGPAAISYLRQRQDVDVILMDLQMPTMDGYQAASIIKALPNCNDIPLIFITAIYTEDPHIRRGYEVGAIDYFSKPFDPDILRMKVGVYSSFRRRSVLLKERERHIRESEEVLKAAKKMSAILESLSVGVIVADTEGRICQINEEVSRILRSARAIDTDAYGEILGWWDRGGRILKDQAEAMAKTLKEGAVVHNELLTVECLDGASMTLSSSTSPLRGIDGRVVGAVIVVHDVTEHKKVGADFEHRISTLLSLGVEVEQSLRA